MLRRNHAHTLLVLIALAVPASAAAHGFGRLYNLPVPFWLYAWGASGALIVSFVIAAVFFTRTADASGHSGRDISDVAWVRGLHRIAPALRGLVLFVLLLCIATALFGNRDPMRNFSMTAFWVVFLLAYTYATALLGDTYAALNPWRTLAGLIGRLFRGFARGRFRYPAWLGDWPALAFYLAFIWFELFGTGRPSQLGVLLLSYTALNLFGVWLIGARTWFRHCEFFSVFLRLVALIAPLEYRAGEDGARGRLHLRWPCAGLMRERPEHLSTVVFAMAMLSTTAFDGLRATQWWVGLFWNDPSGLLTQWAGARPVHAIAIVRPWYIAWETFWLLASPFIYFGLYVAAIALARLLTRSSRGVRELALDFGYTLLPIALVYNVTHYATLVLSHGLKIASLVSDPFGWGWDLFGTAWKFRAPILPEMGTVWHSQVGLILFGHIVSVVVAHLVALRLWPSRTQAFLSQLPMLGLMVAFTVAGLWILSQPLTAMLMR